jgi:ComEC/Rec2-related protein
VWLLLCLAFFVVCAVLTTQSPVSQVKEHGQTTIRIIDEHKSPFVTQQTAQVGSEIYLITKGKQLQKGYEYNVTGSWKSTQNKFLRYADIDGELKIEKVTAAQNTCDGYCRYINLRSDFKRNLEQRYYQAYCSDLVSAIGNRCRQIANLGKALVIGGDIDPDIKKGARVLGMSHVLVVSGWQVALLLTFAEILTQNQSKQTRLLLLFLFGFILWLLVGSQPPVMRALLSTGISVSVLWLTGRKVDYLRSLGWSVILILIFTPAWVFSVSLHLSVLASIGVYLGNWGTGVVQKYVSPTLGASVLVIPYASTVFGISPFTLISNIFILPIIEYLTFAQVLVPIPLLGDIAALLSTPWLLFISELAVSVKNLTIPHWDIPIEVIVIIYAVLLIFLTKVRLKTKKST